MPQEIKKIPIVIASILKPVDDTRMMEKLGPTIGKIDNTAITLIGYPTTGTSFSPEITYRPYQNFNRLSFGRLLARFTFFKNVLSIRPRLIMITTHELLIMALLAKWITGCRLIYDIQENYFRNIMYSKTFPPVIKHVIALWVRMKEMLTSPAIDHFFLAETSYKTELGFLGRRFTILENKVSKKVIDQYPIRKKDNANTINLIFSGTLAKGTGVLEAIRWTKLLHAGNSHIRLTIIGYCAQADELIQIQNEIAGCSYITLLGGKLLVPHSQVLEEISRSDAGFITYPINPSVSGSIPTKLYEYLAFRLPILLEPHTPWVEYCKPWSAAIELDERKPEEILAQLQTGHFYTRTPENIFWEDQEEELIDVIRKVVPQRSAE